MNKDEMLIAFSKKQSVEYDMLDDDVKKYANNMMSRGKAKVSGGLVSPSLAFTQTFNRLALGYKKWQKNCTT